MKCSKLVWMVVVLGAILLMPKPTTADSVVAIAGGETIEVEQSLPDVRDLWVTSEDFTQINGFVVKPQGACFEDICIPIKQDADSELFVRRDGKGWFNATAFADRVQQSYVVDRESGVWSFGAVPSTRKAFLDSAEAPDFELIDHKGELVKLSNFRGKKVMIITWASW